MFTITDINNQSIVVDGAWIEKLDWGGNSKSRAPATQYAGTQIKETSRRKRIFFGEREELLIVMVAAGPILSLTVRADQRPEVDRLIAELERARDLATS